MPYRQKNLVSNVSGIGKTTDPNAQNSFGIAFWNNKIFVVQNFANVVSVYSTTGCLLQTITTPDDPTGIVVNKTKSFLITSGTMTLPAQLIVVTIGGIIAGWNSQLSSNAFIPVITSPGKFFYGAAIVRTSPCCSEPQLFVTDFAAGVVEIYSSNFTLLSTASFTDNALNADGYSPFNIVGFKAQFSESCESSRGCASKHVPLLMVTYAQRTPGGVGPFTGLGNGFINVFTTGGQLISRYASRGRLNAPYGLVIGSNGILVANRGSGEVLKYTTIERFSCDTGCTIFVGDFDTPIKTVCEGVLLNDNISGLARPICEKESDAIFFTAGIRQQQDGLVGVFLLADDCSSSSAKHKERIKEIPMPTMSSTEQQNIENIENIENIGNIQISRTVPLNITNQFNQSRKIFTDHSRQRQSSRVSSQETLKAPSRVTSRRRVSTHTEQQISNKVFDKFKVSDQVEENTKSFSFLLSSAFWKKNFCSSFMT